MANLFETDGHSPRLARVAVERAIDRHPDGLDYLVPSHLDALRPGDRVIVPLGKRDRRVPGYVIERTEGDGSTPRERLKAVLSRDEGGVSLPEPLMALARWVSAYYVCPIGVTLAGMLPAAVKKRVGLVTKAMVDLSPEETGAGAPPEGGPQETVRSADPPGQTATDEAPDEAAVHVDAARCEASREAPATAAPLKKPRRTSLTPKQRAVLETLRSTPASERPVELRALMAAAGLATAGPIHSLARRGLVQVTRSTTVEAEWRTEAIEPSAPPALTPDQAAVVEAVGAALDQGFSAHLLFGVTGSGKTEVYLRLIERVLEAGRMALLLVPEISLTPQTGGRVMARFPGRRVAVLHSGLTAAQRHQQWALVADGAADIVLGARSAVLAPTPPGRLGLIIVDEEHDASYKQDQAPRYHGRDVALRRGQMERCPVLLGSATPSLESWINATERGVHALHWLPRRAPGLTTPAIEIVDFVQERRVRAQAGDRRVHLLGPRLDAAIERTLADGGQVLLLLNRRGFANYVACPDPVCGWLLQCDDCDAAMVCHQLPRAAPGRVDRYVRCHHCLAEKQLPERCPRCGNRTTVFGLGTQRVEEELKRKFPALRGGEAMLRVDSDTMTRASDLHAALRRFASGELRLLVGTQMIAKGLDFPNVRLVGVVSADTALSLPDFRAVERTFQLVSQVAGRCGRSENAGLAIVQTFEPGLDAIQRAARGDYEGFAAAELEDRRRCGLPPVTRMARIVVRHADLARCIDDARRLAGGLRALAPRVLEEVASTLRVRGPAPCPIARIANRHRQQVEIIAPAAATLQKLLAAARGEGLLRPGESMAVDVDCIAMS